MSEVAKHFLGHLARTDYLSSCSFRFFVMDPRQRSVCLLLKYVSLNSGRRKASVPHFQRLMIVRAMPFSFRVVCLVCVCVCVNHHQLLSVLTPNLVSSVLSQTYKILFLNEGPAQADESVNHGSLQFGLRHWRFGRKRMFKMYKAGRALIRFYHFVFKVTERRNYLALPGVIL